MHVLVDLDGVLADLTGEFRRRFTSRWPGLAPLLAAVDAPRPPSLSQLPEPARSRAHAIMDEPGLFSSLPPLPGALGGVAALRAAGHDVTICTAPRPGVNLCASEKTWWVRRHLGVEQARQMVITADKSLVAGDWLIDDWPDQGAGGLVVPAWTQVVFDQPYNRHVDTGLRLHGWDDLGRLLDQHGR